MRHRLRHTFLMACAFGLMAGPAHADKMTDAEELFRRAKTLMNESKYKEACPLLEESEKLDPQMGTLLNLAICHENIGKIASAWGEFRAVEQQAKVANREDRVKLAHERAAKLEPRLPRLKITVPPEAMTSGLVIKVDGEPKGEALWPGVAVDPGTRTVEATAPTKKPATLKVKVDDEGALVPVTIPKLEDAPPPPPPTGGLSQEQIDKNRSRKTMGFVVGAVGVAVLGVGGTFGVLALSKDNEAIEHCPQPCFRDTQRAVDADQSTDRALLFANVSNVAVPLGVVAVAIGLYMIVTAGPTKAPPRGMLNRGFAW